MIVICAACGKDDAWEGFEDMIRLTGEEGNTPEKITVAACECGYQQTVIME